MTIKFSTEFEEDILSACLSDVEYLRGAAKILEEHNFATKHHGWVWKTCKGVWDNYKERTTGKILMARAKADFPKDEDRGAYVELARKLYRRRKGAPKTALEILEQFQRKTNAQAALEEAAKHLDKDDKESIDKVYKIIQDVARRSVVVKRYTVTKWIEGFEERQADRKFRKEHPGAFKRYPTGFKRIDAVLGGGIEVGEFGNIMATTGMGKSIWLTNIAFNTAKFGNKVAIISMEMAARQVNQRLDSRWLDMPYLKFKTYDFSPSELRDIQRKLKRAKKQFHEKVRVISAPVRSISVNGLVDILNDLTVDGFRPDVVFLDSADHMVAPRGRKQDNLRVEQSEIYWAIKGLAEEQGYAIWNSIQAGREWTEKNRGIATVEAASESYDKGRIADIVISLNSPKKKTRSTREMGGSLEDDEDEIKEREAKITGDYMEAYIAKYRDGESKVVIPMDANFTRMHIDEVSVAEEDSDDNDDDKEE